MGLVPPINHPEVASGNRELVVYHGGVVMRSARLHAVFWAPPGYAFAGSPNDGVPAYEPFIQRFLADSAHDSGSSGNFYSVLSQYGDGSGPGSYSLSYDPGAGTIDDKTPYPPLKSQCVSPAGFATCVTDLELERELDKVIAGSDPSARGLHDIWLIFLPPNVDTCTQTAVCGTSEFAGYHSLFDLGHGPTVYAVIVEPTIEGIVPPGSDPQGNPDAESAADVIGHEVVEAATDPSGTGWMDPDGFEVGDKCDTDEGTPLGYGANGSPYNEVLNGRPYLIQAMWSNPVTGCVQAGAHQTPAPDLPRVSLRQFSPAVSGSMGHGGAGVSVELSLLRAGQRVAAAATSTRADGRWRAVLRTPGSRAPLGVGDDRETLIVHYGHGGPKPEVIETGAGGDPFSESGWTGWYDLDSGFQVGRHGVAVAPCGQVGVLVLAVGAKRDSTVADECQTETDVAGVRTPKLGPGSKLSFTSTDNRAPTSADPEGALVSLEVPLGEPGSVPVLENAKVTLAPTGFPVCVADLRTQSVKCGGLVPGARYALTRRGSGRADVDGVVTFGAFSGRTLLRGGQALSLRNRVGRTVTVLHLANLKVAIRGAGASVAGGTCQPGDYWGAPVTKPPVGAAVGVSAVTGSGSVCPPSGHARGLPTKLVEQIDSLGGGLTRTEVPVLASVSPAPGATLYGPFTALAQVPGGHAFASLAVVRRGSHHVAARASGLERPQGVRMHLPAGVYDAHWTVSDVNGDTRTYRSYFVVER